MTVDTYIVFKKIYIVKISMPYLNEQDYNLKNSRNFILYRKYNIKGIVVNFHIISYLSISIKNRHTSQEKKCYTITMRDA